LSSRRERKRGEKRKKKRGEKKGELPNLSSESRLILFLGSRQRKKGGKGEIFLIQNENPLGGGGKGKKKKGREKKEKKRGRKRGEACL